MREVKKQGTMSKMILGMKKTKKKILLKDGVPQKDGEVLTKTDSGQGMSLLIGSLISSCSNSVAVLKIDQLID